MPNETQRDDAIDQMREIAELKQMNRDLLAVCEGTLTAFEQDKWTDAVALHMQEVRTAVANAKVTQPRAAPDLLAACEVIASMERYTFIDTPPIKVVEKLQQQIAEMKTIAQIALANVAKAKPAKKRGER